MALGSNNPFPKVKVVEQASVATPSAGAQHLFIDSADHHLKRKNSSGTITDLEGAGAGTVTHTGGALTSGKTVVGAGSDDVAVSTLTAQFVGSSSGTAAAASMTTARLLGRTTASSGAVEEITVGTGLSLSSGSLTATGGSGGGGSVLLGVYTASGANDIPVVTRNASGQSGAIFQSDYEEYEVRINQLTVSTNNIELRWQFSSNGGSSYNSTSNYYSWWKGNSNTNAAFDGVNNGGTYWLLGTGLGSTSSRSYQAVITLAYPLSTTLGKMATGAIGYTNQSTVGSGTWGGYFDVSGTAFDSFKVFPGTVTVSGNIKVYGLAK